MWYNCAGCLTSTVTVQWHSLRWYFIFCFSRYKPTVLNRFFLRKSSLKNEIPFIKLRFIRAPNVCRQIYRIREDSSAAFSTVTERILTILRTTLSRQNGLSPHRRIFTTLHARNLVVFVQTGEWLDYSSFGFGNFYVVRKGESLTILFGIKVCFLWIPVITVEFYEIPFCAE